jgi:hypothetical protein
MTTHGLHLAALAIASVLALTACGSTPTRTTAEPVAATIAPPPPITGSRTVKSIDGSFEGAIVGTPTPASGFARLRIGMATDEVQDVMGRAPDRSHSYESGKRWIPFYFGNDARRMQVLYRNEGCLIFTGGNIWGGAGGDLLEINVDPAGTCYQP